MIKIDTNTKVSYIGSVNHSSKLEKGEKINIDTYGIYLAPSDISGYNVCPRATSGCREACLYASGRAKMTDKIPTARINRTKMFFNQPNRWIDIVEREIRKHEQKAIRNGRKFTIRFNLTSDLDISNIHGVNLLEKYPHIQFYDYTKVPERLELLEYPNYHLTFSYDGFDKTWKTCEKFLEKGGNVSVVFYGTIPNEFKGYKVINGDDTDARFLDEKGVVVGLKYKRVKGDNIDKIMNNRFIIKTN